MKWIRVDTELPEPGQEVLGAHPIGDDAIYTVCQFTQRIENGDWFWECSSSGEELDGSFKPTHWMPLPPPPED